MPDNKDENCKRWCDERHNNAEKQMILELKNINTRLNAMDYAITLRTAELERRLEGLNQLRQDVVKDREILVRRDYYDLNHGALRNSLHSAIERITVLETRSVVWTLAIGVFFVVCQIALHFWGNIG